MSPGSSIKENCATGNPVGLWQESLACGVLVVDANGRIVSCTPEAAALLQVTIAQLENAPAAALPAPFHKMIGEAARNGQPVTNLEISPEIRDGNATTLWASFLPIKTGAQSDVVVVLNRATSAPFFEQNLRRLDRLASLGTLSASMAHEIKNGMVAIKTFIDLLLQKGQETELTEVVNHELERINAIVTQMLRFAAPRDISFTAVRVHELLDHSLRLLHHQISRKLIRLQRRYHARADTVRGDDAQLQQVFMNLLLNALEAMGPNGVLTVSTEITEGKEGARLLSICIRDTGVGIAREHLDHLFEPFFTTKKNGTGLGLAVCRRIVRDHHGAIQAQSETNQGSTFSLLLPLVSS